MDEPYEKLDKTKWTKYQHFSVLSPFTKSANPLEEYRNVLKKVGFLEDVVTLLENLDMYFKNEKITRGKFFINDTDQRDPCTFNESIHKT